MGLAATDNRAQFVTLGSAACLHLLPLPQLTPPALSLGLARQDTATAWLLAAKQNI